MVPLRRGLVLALLLIALFATIVLADSKDASEDSNEKIPSKSVRSNLRMMRQIRASTTAQHPASGHGSSVTATTPGSKKTSSAASPEREYEQQVLVVKGNPSEEKLNEEIRKAIRALLGPEQGDQVQIRELKNEEELRRVAPGARPIGVRLVP